MLLHNSIRVYGKVQGVFYRQAACEQALRMGINGFVQNLPDGSVYIEAEGAKPRLALFIAWCEEGPPASHVTNVEINEGVLKSFTSFRIVR